MTDRTPSFDRHDHGLNSRRNAAASTDPWYIRSRLNGSIPAQLSYASQFGLFLTFTVPGVIPVVPGKVLRFRTFWVEWHFEHFVSSADTPLARAGNTPTAGIASRTTSWNRKFFSPASHCMYSTAFGWAPGYEACGVIPIVKTYRASALGRRTRGDSAVPVWRLS